MRERRVAEKGDHVGAGIRCVALLIESDLYSVELLNTGGGGAGDS